MIQSITNQDSYKAIDSTITSKGQVTIPAEVRRLLGVKQGDKLTFVVGTTGEINLKATRYPTIASLRGAAGTLKSPLSWKEMRSIARDERFKADKL